ncbi:MAG: hypothetical protein GX846_04250 [Deltaproteobacteria bacterium]|nr:hypothetical protein [Deltaproteobacteria bacterium]
MADLTLNEYQGLNNDEIRGRLFSEYYIINSKRVSAEQPGPVTTSREKDGGLGQSFLSYIKVMKSKKRIPLKGN